MLGVLYSDRGPVVDVSLLATVVVGVEVALPHVVFDIDVVLVDVVPHVDVGEDVLQLRVVVEGDWREGVEVVGVDGLGLCHLLHLGVLSSLLLLRRVGLVGTDVESKGDWVDKEVGAPAHAAKGAHCVRSAHISSSFRVKSNY